MYEHAHIFLNVSYKCLF